MDTVIVESGEGTPAESETELTSTQAIQLGREIGHTEAIASVAASEAVEASELAEQATQRTVALQAETLATTERLSRLEERVTVVEGSLASLIVEEIIEENEEEEETESEAVDVEPVPSQEETPKQAEVSLIDRLIFGRKSRKS